MLFEALSGNILKGIVPFKEVGLVNPGAPFLQKLDRAIRLATSEDKDKRLPSVEQFRTLILEAIKEAGTEAAGKPASTEAQPQASRIISKLPQWTGFTVGLILLLLFVVIAVRWYIKGQPLIGIKETHPTHQVSGERGQKLSPAIPLKALPGTIMGEDGLTRILINGHKPFYVDQGEITFQNYADFLNEVKKEVTVEKGVVKWNNEIWLLMGEGKEPYEQIIYEHGRFHIRDSRYAFYPVVRVTWYGAAAYANHFNKRLPASEELREALLYLKKNTGPLKKENVELQIKIGEIREWAVGKGTLQKAGPGLRSPQEKFPYQSVIFFKQLSLEKAVIEERFPWEGFTDVGFRCILDPTSDNK